MTIKTRVILVISITLLIGLVLVTTRYKQVKGAIRPAFDGEFMTRPDGAKALIDFYELKFKVYPMQMEPGLMYRAISDKAVDVVDGYSTDGRILAYNLQILKDDKHFFPPYYAAPLVRNDTLQKYPKLRPVLNLLAGKLSDETMQKLNYAMDKSKQGARTIAKKYLIKHNLLPADYKEKTGLTSAIVIGGKNFNEQEVLAHMLGLLIESRLNLGVEMKLNLGGTMIVFNALKSGDIDLYPEYTGTGLMSILKKDVITDPDESYKVVKKMFKKEFDLIWLKPFGFNNTYTLTMRKKHAARLNIQTISDLAAYLKQY